MKTRLRIQVLMTLIVIFAVACNPKAKKEAVQEEPSDLVVVEEVDVWVIDEHQINDVPLTSKAEKVNEDAKEELEAEIAEEAEEVEEEIEAEEMLEEEEIMEEEAYEIYAMEAINAALEEQAYEASEIVEVTEVVIPIDETQTVVAYNKKGKPEAAFQVVSSGPDNEVEQIIFTDKKHTDVYDVKAGLSGKEVKRLRREMKHMVKKGQVFLYDDQSNIMYLMNAKDRGGDEITVADVESMDVQAVIWKDKKHHKKK